MALTVNQLIEKLQGWHDKEQLIAYSIWNKDDIEMICNEADGSPEVDYAWGKVVDGVQSELDSGWLVEKISETVTEEFWNHFEVAE